MRMNSFDMVTDFYKAYGVGMFGLNKAFRIEECGDNNIRFRAINNMDKVVLSDLVGYEIQKQKLVENTESICRRKKSKQLFCYLVTVVQVNPQVSKRSLTNTMIRVCA